MGMEPEKNDRQGNTLEGRDCNVRSQFWPPLVLAGVSIAIVGLALRDWGIAGVGIGIAVLGPVYNVLYLCFLRGVRRILEKLSSKR